MKKRALSWLLCAAVALSMFSVPVYAKGKNIDGQNVTAQELGGEKAERIHVLAENMKGIKEEYSKTEREEDVISACDITATGAGSVYTVNDPCTKRVNYNGYLLKFLVENFGTRNTSGKMEYRTQMPIDQMILTTVIEAFSEDQLKVSFNFRDYSAYYPLVTATFYYNLTNNQCTNTNSVVYFDAENYIDAEGEFDGATYQSEDAIKYYMYDEYYLYGEWVYINDELSNDLCTMYDVALILGMMQMQSISNSIGCNLSDVGFYAYDAPLCSNHLQLNGQYEQCALCGTGILPFSDVYSNAWYINYVKDVYEGGYMTGLTPTTFGPLDPIPRSQFAVILHRMNGEEPAAYTERFTDVPSGQWYTYAIMWAAENKIVGGYDDGRFGVGDFINREQMAVMMYRYAQAKEYDVSEKASFESYVDAQDVSGYAQEAMQWAVATGIISGKDYGTRLDPFGSASRAECAAIIMRFVNKYMAD